VEVAVPALSPERRQQRGVVMALSRHREPDDPELIEARARLRALGAEEAAAEIVAGWPPLSDEQVEAVVAILRTGQAVSTGAP
jgi:hypothetical protein